MIESQVELYTDGACERNPGAGGLAYIIKYLESDPNIPDDYPKKKDIEFSQGYRLTTNNRMEISAGLFGMQRLIDLITQNPDWRSVTQINLRSDSEYFCKSINQRWLDKWKENNWMTSGFGGKQPKPVKNKDLWEQVIQCQNQFRSMNVNLVVDWVKGHADDEYNQRADKLAVAASKTYNTQIIDEMYEKTAGYRRN